MSIKKLKTTMVIIALLPSISGSVSLVFKPEVHPFETFDSVQDFRRIQEKWYRAQCIRNKRSASFRPVQ
jgi:hypothetical protein